MIKAKAGPVTLLIATVCAVIYGLQMLGFEMGYLLCCTFPRLKASNGNCGVG